MATIFSKIIRGELPSYKIAEDERHYAFLDIHPYTYGHTLVVPKREVDNYFDLTPDEIAEINVFAQRVAAAIAKSVDCFKIAQLIIGDEVPHAHLHLVPYRTSKELRPSGKKFTDEEMKSIAEKIAAHFE